MDQDEKVKGDEHTSNCIACKLPLSEDASLCPECGSYQKSWKNWIRYWSRVWGIVVAVLALITYLTATAPRIRVLLLPRDSVRLIAFHDYGWIVVHNAGDRDIFVSHFYSESREPQRRHRTKGIYKTVAPGDFLVTKG